MRTSKVFESVKNNRTVKDVAEERDTGYARIPNRNGGGPSYMEMRWNMNEDSKADQVIQISLGKQDIYVYVEDLLRYTRWV